MHHFNEKPNQSINLDVVQVQKDLGGQQQPNFCDL